MADAVGISFQQIQKHEKGTNRVGASRLQDIARFLKTPITSFFDGQASLVAAAERADSGEITVPAYGPDIRREVVSLVKTLAGREEGCRFPVNDGTLT